MSAFRKGPGRPRRWWYALAIMGIVALVAAFTQGTSKAVVSGSPSSFESSDGNMTVETSGNTDWNCLIGSGNVSDNGSTCKTGVSKTARKTKSKFFAS